VTAVLEPVARPAPDSPHAADWALVELAQAGDHDAFAELYRAHHDAVFRFVRWRVKRQWVTEDIVADVFTRAWVSLSRLRYTGNAFSAWLLTVARNRVADHFKSAWASQVSPAEPRLVDELTAKQSDPAAEEDVVRAELAAAVRRALTRLPDQQRRVVELRFLRGLDIAETAAAIGANPGATKALQFRAMGALRRNAPELEEWR
jgi:RNA polymerase sigma-70 factor (ECF subfamily)